MDGSKFEGSDSYVDPDGFCGVAARMLAAGGRDCVPAVLTLLGQALRADVRLREAGTSTAAIPKPRIRGAAAAIAPAAVDLPVRARDTVLAVLSIEPTAAGLPMAWTVVPGPLGTMADLLALTLAAGWEPAADRDVRATAHTWFELEESDRLELAGDLHDGLVQSLVAARYLLDLAASAWPDGPQPWLDAVRESLQAALADGRGLLTSVRPRTRDGRGLRTALDELCARSAIPVQLHAADIPAELAADIAARNAPRLTSIIAAVGYRFVQAALADLRTRGGDAAQVRLAYAPGGLSLDVSAVGDRPAWPDETGAMMRRLATRIELLGGSVQLQPASAHLRFGSADGIPASLFGDVHAGRTM